MGASSVTSVVAPAAGRPGTFFPPLGKFPALKKKKLLPLEYAAQNFIKALHSHIFKNGIYQTDYSETGIPALSFLTLYVAQSTSDSS